MTRELWIGIALLVCAVLIPTAVRFLYALYQRINQELDG